MLFLGMLAVLSGITIPILQTRSQAMTNQLAASEAVNLVRLISTIEGEKKATEQSFVSLQKLLQHRVMQSRLREINIVDVDSATIKDYRLSVVPSADGQHFELSLVPKSGCGYSLFTNESFVIHEAKAPGCPEQ
jgi:hypothetical protein